MAFAAAALPTILTVASIGVGIAGAVVGAQSQIAANNYQKQVAERQAQINEWNAQRAIQNSQVAQIQQDDQTRALLGEQLAEQSASGLSIYSKSSMLTRKTARQLGRIDALNVRNAGDIEAFNYRMAAQDNYEQMKYLDTSNQNTLLTGFLDAASVGLTGLRSQPTLLTNILGNRKTSGIKAGLGVTGSALRFAS